MENEIYLKLIDLLKKNNISFKEVSHGLEGKSEKVAKLRGSSLEQGAKAMVLKTKNKYILAVLSSNLKIDLKKVAHYLNEKKVDFASLEEVEKITKCKIGAVPPFSFSEDLILIVDSSITKVPEIAFNAARLDKSIFLKTDDYLMVAKPNIADISK